MSKNHIEQQLLEMDNWFMSFLNKYSDKVNKQNSKLWTIYNTEMKKYIELKQEYRIIQLQG